MTDNTGLVSVDVIARLFDLTVRRVQQLAKAGIIPRGKRDQYPLAASVQGYIRFLKGDKAQQEAFLDVEVDVNRARVANLHIDTEIKRLKKEELERRNAPIDVIAWVLGQVSGQISPLLEAIPLKVSRRVPGLSATEIEIITREIIKAQNAAAAVTIKLDEYRPNSGSEASD